MDDDDFNVSVGDEEFGMGNSTFNSVTLNETLDSSFEEYRVENEGLQTSTPKKDPPKGKQKEAFKLPKAPPSNYFRKCALCGNYLKTERGFKGHMQGHKWKDNAKLKPPVKEVVEFCSSESKAILEKLVAKFSVPEGDAGHLTSIQITTALRDVRENILESDFLKFVLAKLTEVLSSKEACKVMPSALRFELQVAHSRAFSSTEFRDNLLTSFLQLTPAQPSLAWNIIFCFFKEIFDAACIFVCQKLRGPAIEECNTPTRSKDDFNHHHSQQVVHYVAGSCLKSHFRLAHTYPNNQAMRNIKECILLKFARVGIPSVVEKKNPDYWTALLNRKSLFFLHLGALPFFLQLCKLLQKLEAADGSLNHEKVMENIVATNTLTILWDGIVDNCLSEDESFHFMMKVVKAMTNTFGRGVMLRRMNAVGRSGRGNKAALAISHRARLVGKE